MAMGQEEEVLPDFPVAGKMKITINFIQ